MAKRSASPQIDHSSKRSKPNKSCITCCESDVRFPALAKACLRTRAGKHSNDMCKFCWSKYIKINYDGNEHGTIACAHENCTAFISWEDISKIMGKRSPQLAHFDYLNRRAKAKENGEYECLADILDAGGNEVTCHHFQTHDVEKDGRVKTCAKCESKVCIPCEGVPEHDKETCTTRNIRMKVEHGDEETCSHKTLIEGYVPIELGKHGGTKRWRIPVECPCCGIWSERADGCQHVTCIKCACEFCVVCALLKHKMSYYGPGSVPQLGNKGHHPGCSKYSAKKEDRRYLTPAARNRVKVEKKEADGDSNGEE